MRRRLLGEASRRLRDALARESSGATTARVALQAISACYVAGSRAHSWLYDAGLLTRRRLPAPTVSVGNFTAGGTGKTPLVQHISAILEDAGCMPLVVARGYGDDEAYQMRHRFEYATSEVVCGADRYDAVDRHRRLRAQSQQPPDVFVLDDGLQHWPVARDLDVVVVNAYDPWGQDTLLRERPRDGLARANLIVLHNCAPGALPREHIRHIRQELVKTASREKFDTEFAAAADPQSSMNRPACPPVVETYATPRALLCDSKSEFFVSTHGNKPDDADIYWKDSETGATMHSVDDMTLALRGRTVVAVSGIGCPDAFADMIKHQLGAACVDTQVTSFPDHHVITDDDVSVVERRVAELSAASFADNLEGCAQQPVIVVTTEKDFFRCANHPGSSFIARLQPLVISMDVAFCHAHEESVLADMLLGVVNESSSSSSSLSAKTSTTHSSQKLHVAVGHPRTNKSLHNQPHAARAFSSGATVMKHMDRTYGAAEPSEFPFRHVPVLAEEVARVWMPPARFLSGTSSPPQPCLMVDATAGGGGHSKALLDATVEHSNVRVLCIDRDAKALQVCSQRLQDAGDRVFLPTASFPSCPQCWKGLTFPSFWVAAVYQAQDTHARASSEACLPIWAFRRTSLKIQSAAFPACPSGKVH